jgi:endonuclease YncB( thermonuclease family)
VPLVLVALALLGAALGGCGRSRWELATSPAERASWPGPPAGTVAARVERVVDGDTFETTVAGRREHVRLIGLDTPETVAPGRPVEPYGPQASAFAKHWLAGTTVRVAGDAEPRDHYGRLLAYAWLGDGTFWNALLLAEGYAQPLTIRPNDAFEQLFARLAAAARSARRGLWAGGRRAALGAAAVPAGGHGPAQEGPPGEVRYQRPSRPPAALGAGSRSAAPSTCRGLTDGPGCWGPRVMAGELTAGAGAVKGTWPGAPQRPGGSWARMCAPRPECAHRGRKGSLMQSAGPDDVARRLAEEARPVLGADGFSDERIDELAFAFVNDHVGEGGAQFVRWALAEGPFGLDPEEGF